MKACLLPLFFCAATLTAAVQPGTPFGNHAVLQADMKVPVWGMADPGERVKVSYDGQSKEAVADVKGYWRVDLEPMTAGKSGELVIGDKTFSDVVTGEVWFVGGQSNAALALKSAVPNAAAEIAKANYPQIRVWTSQFAAAETPQAFGKGSWKVCTPQTAGDFTGMGYCFAKELSAAKGNVPVGILSCNRGGAPVFSMMDTATFEKNPNAAEVEAYFGEFVKKAQAKAKAGKGDIEPDDNPKNPLSKNYFMRKGVLYNGMVFPLAPYAMRGVLWNQGEADVRLAKTYESLFADMVKSWRALWGRADLPFYVVQLANISDKGSYEPSASENWPLIREAQSNARTLPHVWVSVGTDIGNLTPEANKARHPANKDKLGERLSLLALGTQYGKGGVYASAFFDKATVKGDKIVCVFDAAGKGLKTSDGKAPGGFEIAGADGKFVPAQAAIEGDTIVVSAPEVKSPKAARYAWSNTCAGANVVNAAALPLAPFRVLP